MEAESAASARVRGPRTANNSGEMGGSNSARAAPSTSLSGRRLTAARATWTVIVSVTIGLFTASIPFRREQLADVFRGLTPSQELVLRELGVTGAQHAGFALSVEVGVTIVFFALAFLMFARRSRDWVAMFVSGSLVTYIAWISPTLDALLAAVPALWLPGNLLQVIGMVTATSFFYIFPDGRLVPRPTIVMPVAWTIWGVLWLAMPGSIFDVSNPFMLPLGVFLLHMSWWMVGMAAQAYRYARVATPVQQQQTKLVIFGVTVGLLGYVVFGFNRFALPVLAEPLHANVVYDLIGVPLFLMIHIVVPISFTVSFLRYRLWDIDLIVNRAVVYGLLTATLAGLYTASITFSQRLFTALTGERSDAAIVVTTLVVASAFTPLKNSLQTVVDRYLKRPPDPTENLRAFGSQVRTLVEVIDVEHITRKALEEAVRAFVAANGAAYLLRDGRFQLVHVVGDWTQVEGMSAWLEDEGHRYGWLALGPRRTGVEYTLLDRKVFAETVGLVARSIRLVEGADFKHAARQMGGSAAAKGGSSG